MTFPPHSAKRRSPLHPRRATRAFAVALAAGALAACSANSPLPGPGAADNRVSLVDSSDSVMVQAATPEEVSARTSEALFASAPAAILVDSSAAATLGDAAADTGIPVLAVSGTSSAASPEASSSPAATPGETASDSPGTPALDAELDRLGADAVLALGPQATAVAGGLGVEVVTDRAALPDVEKAEGASTTAVITADPDVSQVDDTATAAVAATAAAAGATYVRTESGDPRETRESVDALAQAKPGRVVGVGAGLGDPQQLAARVAAAATGVQLPGGGQIHHPGKQYIALYGHPGSPVLGVLGEQDVDASVTRAREHAAAYEPLTDLTVVPMFEIITTVALGDPSPNGNYTNEVDPELLRPWIERAEQEGIYVVIDLQPGRADLLDQAKIYQSLLSYPHVGLAIDPEWKLTPTQRPLRQIGSVEAEEVNRVSDWLAQLTREENLPQKLLVLHQFRLDMIPERDQVRTDHDELQVLVHVDGQGGQEAKQGTWEAITRTASDDIVWGWKNFYDEDQPMLTPQQTIDQVDPTPVMISYQ